MKEGTFLISLFLSSLILYNTLRVSVTYIYYTIDPIGFIEELCENKDTPEMQCNGKCQLKKVTESSQSSEKTPVQLIDFKDLLLFKESPLSYSIVSFFEKNQTLFSYANNYAYLNSDSSFHPPQV
ncbi:hypothetical protein IU405_09520 [Polaribacter sp. BAL334]|uniref:hypothetical protein n=1 Tax=Polaribacter sp. BAL334 TaxID=1708178 RepID=UPI0018D2276F|nr:hypothetical protein [Polaribacter sp. BAL334]MBG7612482.1 hypothetical protein [Polaribacter sp. BAL334]